MKTILLVEDEECVRDYLAISLVQDNFSVLQAENAFEALEFLSKDQVDLILSDVKMPGMSGPEMYEKIIGDKPPTIFMTGNCSEEDAKKIKRFKTPLLQKPLSRKDVLLEIKRILSP